MVIVITSEAGVWTARAADGLHRPVEAVAYDPHQAWADLWKTWEGTPVCERCGQEHDRGDLVVGLCVDCLSDHRCLCGERV